MDWMRHRIRDIVGISPCAPKLGAKAGQQARFWQVDTHEFGGGTNCWMRRIDDIATLQAEVGGWAERTNAKQRAVDWQFTIEKARVKLKRLYPKV